MGYFVDFTYRLLISVCEFENTNDVCMFILYFEALLNLFISSNCGVYVCVCVSFF